MMKSRRMSYKYLVGKPEGRNHSEDLGVDGKIILEWMLGKQSGMVRTGSIWLEIETIGRLL
jgi:hypothetical protein